MSAVDHLLIFVIAFLQPVAGYVSFMRLLRLVRGGHRVDRRRLYVMTVASHFLLFFVVLANWNGADRPWPLLGFDFRFGPSFVIGAALVVVAIGFLFAQVRAARAASPQVLRALRRSLGTLKLIIPRSREELRRFDALSTTAGIVEETLWRGFMIWYLQQLMPLPAAALLSAVGFGIAHAYQGLANLPRITLVGGGFAALYLFTGSLWLPIILHAAVDMLQGRVGFEIMQRTAPGAGDDNRSAASPSR